MDRPSLFDYWLSSYKAWRGRQKQRAARHELRESELPELFKAVRWVAGWLFFVVVLSLYLQLTPFSSSDSVGYENGFYAGMIAGVAFALLYPVSVRPALYETFNVFYFGVRSIVERRKK